MKCSTCGAQLPENSTFCVECGARVEAKAGNGGSFFSNAGDLGGEPSAPVASVWDTYHQAAPAAEQPPVQQPPRKCPGCGAVLADGDMFCVNCGLDLRSGQKPAAERRAPQPKTPAPAVRTKVTKSSRGMLIGIGAGALALILLVVIIGAATGWFGLVGPGAQMLSAAEKTLKKGNFTVEFEMSDGYGDYEGTALVDIDVKKREVQLYMEMDSDGDEMIIAIYDGYLLTHYVDYDYYYAEKISSELDDIFDAYESARSGDREEIADMLEDMGLDEDDVEDYMDLEELEKSIRNLVKKLNNKSWLQDNAGYSTRKDAGATIHSLEPDVEDLLIAVLEILEPAFQDEDDYEDAVDEVEYIDDVDVLVEIGIKSGYLVSVDMEYADDWDEMELHAAFTEIGKTKIDEAELEELLDECK
ncbi:MAG: zinc-ribbon domain-containing protein [Oscillospiraceae bacterium]|nr:zinc-ribbon domain-containing protein [Oscillospiraceae bacterium]